MLKIQLCITGINLILQYIQIEKLFSILIMFHNITDLTVFLDQMNEALENRRDVLSLHF